MNPTEIATARKAAEKRMRKQEQLDQRLRIAFENDERQPRLFDAA